MALLCEACGYDAPTEDHLHVHQAIKVGVCFLVVCIFVINASFAASHVYSSLLLILVSSFFVEKSQRVNKLVFFCSMDLFL